MVFCGQLMQFPFWSTKDPAGQALQIVAPVPEVLPCAQERQEIDPGEFEYVFLVHGTQSPF